MYLGPFESLSPPDGNPESTSGHQEINLIKFLSLTVLKKGKDVVIHSSYIFNVLLYSPIANTNC